MAFVVFGQQSKPDLNGNWVMNQAKSEKAIREGLTTVRGRMTITLTEKVAGVIPRSDGRDPFTLEVFYDRAK